MFFYRRTKMLIKEYRIPMPMSVEEYRIAQLYMIQVIFAFVVSAFKNLAMFTSHIRFVV